MIQVMRLSTDVYKRQIIYCAEAVKSGRLKLPEEKLDYFTAAGIESYWDNYQYEIVTVLSLIHI